MEKTPVIRVNSELLGKFREREDQAGEEIIRRHWRSIACMSCGICCCSDVVPIMYDDFSAFYKRLNPAMSEKEFAAMFLKDTQTNAPAHSIETRRYGGRCMFLSKNSSFECVVWGIRPGICADFYCWEMTNFEKWLEGVEQDTFEGGEADFMANFQKLLEKVITESPLSFFAEDMARYMKIAAGGPAPGFFEANRLVFLRKDAPGP